MFFKLAGLAAILFGILWSVNPEFLRNWLTRKTGWQLMWLLTAVLFFPLFRLGKTAGILGISIIFILFFFVLSRAWEAVRDLFRRVPAVYFRSAGVLNIVWGIWVFRFK